MRRHVMTYRSSDISDMFIVMRRQGKNWPSWKEWQDKEGNITTLQRQSQSHLRHWLQFWQLRPSIHDNLCYLTIKSDTLDSIHSCETQPPASIGWVALSSVVHCSSRIGTISSHLPYLMFPSIQTIYFLWGYDPGNVSVPTYLVLLSWAQFTVV